uniref:Uncharacterized protein n=1 Tax=Fundulus heteroclitus TaxID=8078 RepID=A0A3Q2NMX4_FUNHE
MDRGAMLTAALLCCWSLSLCVVTAIRRTDLFPYGALTGDLILPEGDDETSRALTLPRPFYFFDSPFSQLYVSGHQWHHLSPGPAYGEAVRR